MQIIKYIKRIFGKRVVLRPIADTNIYELNENSYSGNSLQDSNVLIIGNDDELIKTAENKFKDEGCYVAIINNGFDDLQSYSIDCAEETMIGHFDHIVNIIKPNDDHGLFKLNGMYNNRDVERVIYQWLQIEVDYLDKNQDKSTLHVVFIKHQIEYIDVLSFSIVNMLRGLARRLLLHGIVANGIIADENIPQEIVMQSLMFVAGKYGEVIAGEFLELKQ